MIRRVIGAGFGVAVGLTGLAASAWACTSTPIMTLQPVVPVAAADTASAPGRFAAAASDSQLTVKMTNGAWAPTQAVQIHWNGLAGPLLATTQGGNFSASVQVPQVAPGVYYLTATDPAGTTRISQALEVTGPATGTAAVPSASLVYPAVHRGSNPMMLGAEVLGGGIIALFSVAAVATFSRRRASANRS